MKSVTIYVLTLLILSAAMSSCKKEEITPPSPSPTESESLSSEVTPIDVNEVGIDLLGKMQGHWIGQNEVLSWEWEWFAFDYRAISPSHVFGIYEGGSLGNLFTSFFVTDFKGTRTIMARNGGLLSGIYRTSYFVLDSVTSESGTDYFRLVDAVGGERTMSMELSFSGDSLNWNAYTSRLGENALPTRHFSFRGTKNNLQFANTAAAEVGFPQNIPAWDFNEGFVEENLYVIPEEHHAKSATFLAQANENDVFTLAYESGDPFVIQDHPHIGLLQVDVDRNTDIQNDKLFIYLSFEPLTNSEGFFVWEAFESILQFPDVPSSIDSQLFTYLHPGDYYVTVIADHNGDGVPGPGDITHSSEFITVDVGGEHQITITNIDKQN